MRSRKLATAGKALLLFAAVLFLILAGAGCSRAGDAQENLQLEVTINDAPANTISSFVLFGNKRIGATASELKELGLQIDDRRPREEIVMLDDIPTLKYEYDEKTQKINITVDDTYRVPRAFNAGDGAKGRPVRSQPGWGTVLNYDLFGATDKARDLRLSSFAGSSISLDARAFSPYGTFAQSGIIRSLPDQSTEAIRLDTSIRISDEERLITYGAGDTINGGLAWTRPIRIGGLQTQSNFALRPDLITMPLPSVGGTAAVPSTVDVYINNIKTFSQDVGAGPFRVNNVPLITGAGSTELVIRDSAGHETKTKAPFYASANLLAPELMAWSLEAGFPRLFYGSTSDTYVDSPVGSATLRRGIYDWLTMEGHTEAGAGVANGGIGAVVKTGNFGVAGVALSASNSSGNQGFQTYISYETRLFGLNINASSQRSFGSYDDLASATSRLQSASVTGSQNVYGLFNYLPSNLAARYINTNIFSSIYGNARPALAIDRITLSAPVPFDLKSSLSASFLHTVSGSGDVSDIVSATYTRSLPFNASLYATVFRDLGTNRNTGVYVGLSVPLGSSVSISSGVSSGQGGTTANVEAVKAMDPQPGSYGWHIYDAEGAAPYREASASYRSKYGTVQAGVSQANASSNGSVELRGSITTMGGGVFFSNWIDDSFAVVDVGVPGVEVLHENRSMGVTGADGMLLLPSLRSYQANKVAIDPSNLPIDAEIESTRNVVAPADRAGVLVKFDVRSDTTSALVTFVRPDGGFVPAGATGRIDGGSEFVVGYDGQTFIKDLADRNLATIEFGDGSCRASFEFRPRPGEQVQIAPVLCR